MTDIENADIGEALKRLLVIRGSSAFGVMSEIVPVVQVGDTLWPPYSRRRPFQWAVEIVAQAGVTGALYLTNFINTRGIMVIDAVSMTQTAGGLGKLRVGKVRQLIAVSQDLTDTDTLYSTGNTEVSSYVTQTSSIEVAAVLIETQPVEALNRRYDMHSKLWVRYGDSGAFWCTTNASSYTVNVRGYWDP